MALAIVLVSIVGLICLICIIGSEVADKRRRRREWRWSKEKELREAKSHHWEGFAVVRRIQDRLDSTATIYVDSIEATRCTCWNEHMTYEEYDQYMKEIVERLKKKMKGTP